MRTYLKYFLSFLMPLLLVSTVIAGFSIWRNGSFDIFSRAVSVVVVVMSAIVSGAISCYLYFFAVKPETVSFAVSSEKGRKFALDNLESMLIDDYSVKRTALLQDECFRGEISFIRGIFEPVSISNNTTSISVTAPKKLMDAVKRLMKEIQWDI